MAIVGAFLLMIVLVILVLLWNYQLQREATQDYRIQTLNRFEELGASSQRCEKAFRLCSDALRHEMKMADFYKVTSQYSSLNVTRSNAFMNIDRKEPELNLNLSNGKCSVVIYWHDSGNIAAMVRADCLTGETLDYRNNSAVTCQSIESLKEKGIGGFFIKQWLQLALYHYG